MQLRNLTKEELIKIIEDIQGVLNGLEVKSIKQVKTQVTVQKTDLESLIGSLPFLLQDKQIFKTNADMADFAIKLDLAIPRANKMKRDEIVGLIISAVISYDNKRIKELNAVINSIKKEDSKGIAVKKDKSSFFLEWDTAIKQMKIK